MCGIAGFIDFNKKTDFNILKKMTDVLYHRGPDDSGYSFYHRQNYHIGLGHRRLSILDLSKYGHQPMKFDNLEIVYNGEVYNFKEIRCELEKYGYTFESNSDTEVILKAYHKWGIETVHKFNGMFAIAIYDKKEEKLVLIRDRAGVKPLYYYFKDNLLMFASELKSFHQNYNFKKEIDLNVVSQYLQFGYILEPYSIFKNTYKLKAGHYLKFSLKNKQMDIEKYWDVIDYYNKPKLQISEDEVIKETEKLLKSAFNYRMIADVPVGVFLSGGYDSSIVTAILQKNSTEKLKTFTIGFYEEKYNEANYAKEVAKYLRTDHTEYYCTQKEALDIVPTLSEVYDEPFADQSVIPTILVSKLAKQSVTVSLSADGGDEIFGGYNKYLTNLEMKSRIFKLLKIFGKNNLESIAYSLQKKGIIKDKFFINKIAKLAYEENIELQKLISYFTTPLQIQKLIGSCQNLDTNFDKIDEVKDTHFNKMFAIDYKTYMIDDVLHKVDRATMSVSLEGREPLLDYRIIEFVAQLPDRYKIKDGEKKWLLKQITHKYIPKEIMDRPKMGFGVPIEKWLKNELKYLIEDFFELDSILDKKELSEIKSLFFQNRVNYQMILNILIFQMWWKRWME